MNLLFQTKPCLKDVVPQYLILNTQNLFSMKHISILVPKGAILGSLEGTRQLFTQVNDFFKSKGAPPCFEVHLVGLNKETLLSGGSFTAHADVTLADVKQTDLIIIPAIDGEIEHALLKNRNLYPGLSSTTTTVRKWQAFA